MKFDQFEKKKKRKKTGLDFKIKNESVTSGPQRRRDKPALQHTVIIHVVYFVCTHRHGLVDRDFSLTHRGPAKKDRDTSLFVTRRS